MPRVTEILEAQGVMKGSPWFEPRHRIRGTLVHDACAMIGAGTPIPPEWWQGHSGSPSLPSTHVEHEECREYVEAYIRWKDLSGWHMDAAEREVRYGDLYVGHIDQVGSFNKEPDTWIIDLKNGESERWHPLQLALYQLALDYERRPFPLVHRANLYLPSGKFIERTNPRDLRAALILAQAEQAKLEYA